MVNLIKSHLEELKEINRQRVIWLRLSGFVALAILAIIVDWNYVKDTKWGWIVVSVGLVLSLLWWFWTMIVIRRLISQKTIETEALVEIITDVKEIKNIVNTLDKSK